MSLRHFLVLSSVRHGRRGLRLIELLAVVLIIAILSAVSLSSALGATGEAQDFAAQQNIASTIDEADAYYATNQQFSSATSLAYAINQSEPALSVRNNLDGATFSNGPSDITVSVDNPSTATVCDQSSSGRFFCEQANRTGTSSFSTAASESDARCELPIHASGCTDATAVSGWTSSVAASATPTPSRDSFMLYSDNDTGALLSSYGNRMSVVAPEWFTVSPTADTVYSGSSSACTTDPTGFSTVMADSAAQGFQVWPVLNLNWGSSTGTTAPTGNAPLLDNSSDVASIINGIVSCVQAWQNKGVDFGGYTLDMEGMWASNSNGTGVTSAYSQQAQTTAFVQQLASDLHVDGLDLAVHSPRRTTSNDASTGWTARSYNWSALSQAADLLVATGYNENGPVANAGPITTNAGWQAMVSYAKSVSSSNIVPIAGAFGYDWPDATGAASVTVNASQVQSPATLAALAASNGITPTLDSSSGESAFTYGSNPDVVYYENAQSLASRVTAAQSGGLNWWGLFPAQNTPTAFWSLILSAPTGGTPAISGTAQIGSTLTGSPGAWNNSPTSYTYQWDDCTGASGSVGTGCTPISGATNTNYIVQASDDTSYIELIVTASNAAGTATASVTETNPVDFAATQVLGQGGSFTVNTANDGGLSAASLDDPTAVAVDPSGGTYVADSGNNRVLYYPTGTTTPTVVYGQGGSFTSGTANNGGISANSLDDPTAVVLEANGDLYVTDTGNNRVLYFPAGSTTATHVYGQAGFSTGTANNGGVDATSLNEPAGIALDASGDLYVADKNDNRVLYFPAGSTTARRVYGQEGSFTTRIQNDGGLSASSLNYPLAVAISSHGGIYVSDEHNSRILYYPSGATAATAVYGQDGSFTTGTANDGGGPSSSSIYDPWGIALDSNGDLYVADPGNNRVLYFPAGSTTATRVYGQAASFTARTSNNGGVSATSLHNPTGVAIAPNGNLVVSDEVNSRVVGFP